MAAATARRDKFSGGVGIRVCGLVWMMECSLGCFSSYSARLHDCDVTLTFEWDLEVDAYWVLGGKWLDHGGGLAG